MDDWLKYEFLISLQRNLAFIQAKEIYRDLVRSPESVELIVLPRTTVRFEPHENNPLARPSLSCSSIQHWGKTNKDN